jgi:hypothetical protein
MSSTPVQAARLETRRTGRRRWSFDMVLLLRAKDVPPIVRISHIEAALISARY